MELFKNTTDLIGLKDNNITISFVLKHQTHIEIRAKLDYLAPACPFCQRNMIKYDFQKPSTIPILDVQGMPTLFKLKRRRFHIIQHLSRAMMSTKIAIMKSFDTQSLPYRAMKNHWRILQKDSRKLSLETFYSRTFRQTLTPREVVHKTLPFSKELRYYYDLYQILHFHFQEKQASHFWT
ncbi:hypothetical protein Sp14A_07760 [Streptococcus pluranimalium]|uniref:Transposase IS204/IS1001/IS1096/IS1165 zinc-finger domain-containing protein n=1 Tax=Streptococcus pluranimalium TaxID=82348 RepID=A0A345VIZ9_9STRE|nr:hypothetical protein Sp14A_07760 [Streptococcus pluranimalium]